MATKYVAFPTQEEAHVCVHLSLESDFLIHSKQRQWHCGRPGLVPQGQALPTSWLTSDRLSDWVGTAERTLSHHQPLKATARGVSQGPCLVHSRHFLSFLPFCLGIVSSFQNYLIFFNVSDHIQGRRLVIACEQFSVGLTHTKATLGESGPGSCMDEWEDPWQCLWISRLHTLTVTWRDVLSPGSPWICWGPLPETPSHSSTYQAACISVSMRSDFYLHIYMVLYSFNYNSYYSYASNSPLVYKGEFRLLKVTYIPVFETQML